jgi:Family of unknown function (DUF6677)
LADTTEHDATHAGAADAAERRSSGPIWPAAIVLLASWAIPGLGHALQRRWVRAAGFFVAVGGLAITGYLMRGEVFGPHSRDSFGTLGFLADAAAGAFYFLAHVVETAGPDISRAAGNYGTRFVAAAGLVNLMGAIDAVEIVLGRRG